MDGPSLPETPHDEQRGAADFARGLLAATPRAWVTPAIVAVNGLVFALMVATGVSPMEPDSESLLRWGADYGPRTTSGEWWRLLTSAFVHIGILHIAMNMWAFWQSGRLAERFYGNAGFLALYLLCALGGSVTSLLWNPVIVSAGASGAIFGVYGGLLAIVALHSQTIPTPIFRDLRKSTIGFVAYNVIYGMTVPGIDNAAHLGGLATGFLLGWCLRPPLPGTEPASRHWLARASPILAVLFVAAIGARFRTAASPEVRAEARLEAALTALRAGDAETALREIEAALEMNPRDPRSLSIRGDARWARGDRDGAILDYDMAIGMAPEYAYPRMRRAWTWQDQGNLEKAIAGFTEAIRLDPKNASALHGRGWTRVQSGQAEMGLADLKAALKLEPGSESTRFLHAHALYNLGRYADALREFQELTGKDSRTASIACLYVWVLRSRLGELGAASQELRSRIPGAEADEALSRIASFLLDGLDAKELLAGVDARDKKTSNGQPLELCEAWFFIGMKRLVLGSREEALHALRRSLSTRAIDSPTWSSASAEVAALER